MGDTSGQDGTPRLSHALVVAVAGALAAAHLLKGLARIPAEPGTGLAITAAALALVALQLRHLPPGLRRPAVAPAVWTAAELTVAGLAVLPLGVSIGLLCLPAGSLLLERRRLPLLGLCAAAAVIEATRSGSVRDTLDMTLTVALGGVMLYAVTTLALLATRVHGARLTLAAAAVTSERLRIAAGLRAGLSAGLDEIHGLARQGDPALLNPLLAVARRTLAATRATAAELRSLSLSPRRPAPAPCWTPPVSPPTSGSGTRNRSDRPGRCWRRCCAKRSPRSCGSATRDGARSSPASGPASWCCGWSATAS